MITSRDMLRGFGHRSTTGVLDVTPMMTFAVVAVLPSQFIDLTFGSFFEPFAYSGSNL